MAKHFRFSFGSDSGIVVTIDKEWLQYELCIAIPSDHVDFANWGRAVLDTSFTEQPFRSTVLKDGNLMFVVSLTESIAKALVTQGFSVSYRPISQSGRVKLEGTLRVTTPAISVAESTALLEKLPPGYSGKTTNELLQEIRNLTDEVERRMQEGWN